MAQSQRQINTTNYPLSFFLGTAGLTLTIQISKNGAAFAAAAGGYAEPGGSGNGKGFYDWTPNAGDRDTLGPLKVVVTATGADTFSGVFEIVSFDPFSPILQENVTFKVT